MLFSFLYRITSYNVCYTKLLRLRQQIDKLDTDVLEILKTRMEISEAIGKYKKENNITILQTRRYA